MGTKCSCLKCENKENNLDHNLSTQNYLNVLNQNLFGIESKNIFTDYTSRNLHKENTYTYTYDYDKIKFLKSLTQGEKSKISSFNMTLINSYIRGYLLRKKYKTKLKKELINYGKLLIREYLKLIGKNKKVNEFFDFISNSDNDVEKLNKYLNTKWNEFYKENPNKYIDNKIKNIKLYKNGLIFKYHNKNFHSNKIIECLGSAEYCFKGEVSLYSNKKCGQGEIFYSNGSRKKGTFYNNEFAGWNIYVNHEAILYVGLFVQDKLNGKGLRYDKEMDHLYKGDFLEGMREGWGEEDFNCSKYVGEFKGDKKNGKGKIIFGSGDFFEGGFKDNKMNGYGCYFWKKNGHEYKGNYLNGNFHGMGFYKWGENEYYLGKFNNGIKEGIGEIGYADGSKLNINFTNGKPNGLGILQNSFGQKKPVQFIDGKINENYKKK